jgi:hypothetical protein
MPLSKKYWEINTMRQYYECRVYDPEGNLKKVHTPEMLMKRAMKLGTQDAELYENKDPSKKFVTRNRPTRAELAEIESRNTLWKVSQGTPYSFGRHT